MKLFAGSKKAARSTQNTINFKGKGRRAIPVNGKGRSAIPVNCAEVVRAQPISRKWFNAFS
jgi:hypothetical protein